MICWMMSLIIDLMVFCIASLLVNTIPMTSCFSMVVYYLMLPLMVIVRMRVTNQFHQQQDQMKHSLVYLLISLLLVMPERNSFHLFEYDPSMGT